MKAAVTVLVFVLNIFYVSTRQRNLDDRLPGVEPTAIKKEWPEQLFASEEVKLKPEEREEPNKEDENMNGYKQLFGKDYFRVDSEDSDEKTLANHASRYVADWLNSRERKQYKKEVAAGDVTQLFGTNPHYYQPKEYKDLSRRFVLQYPYKEVVENQIIGEAADRSLMPKLAPPELVLAVAKESALLDAARPVNPSEHFIEKQSLRTGDYWNAFWKEDLDPLNVLRTSEQNQMKGVRAKLSPGTEIYDYVSQLQQQHPKLLYVINKKN